jgi:outer membrane protein assembly factor BamB
MASSIRSTLVATQLGRSPLAKQLQALPLGTRLDAHSLTQQLDAFEAAGGVLTDAEKRRLVPVQEMLGAPSFYETSLDVLTQSVGVKPQLKIKKLEVTPWAISLPDYASGEPVLSLDRSTLYSANCDGHLKAFDPNTGEQKFEIQISGHVDRWGTPLLSADGNAMFVRNGEQLVKVDLEKREVVWRAELLGGLPFSGMCFDPRGDLVVTADDNRSGYLGVIDSETGKPRWSKRQAEGYHTTLAPETDGKQVFITQWCRGGGRHTAYDSLSGEENWALDIPDGYGKRGQLLSPDGATLFACTDGLLSAIDTATGKQKWTDKKDDRMEQGTVRPVLTPEGKLLTLVGSELRIYDAETGAEEEPISIPKEGYDSLQTPVLSKDGKTAITHDFGGAFFRIDLEERTATKIVNKGKDSSFDFIVAPDGDFAFQTLGKGLGAVKLPAPGEEEEGKQGFLPIQGFMPATGITVEAPGLPPREAIFEPQPRGRAGCHYPPMW